MEKQQVMAIAAGLQICIRIFLVFSHFPLVLVIFGLMPSSCKRISGPFDPPRGLPGFSLLVFSLRETQPKIVRVLDAGHTTITFAFLVFFVSNARVFQRRRLATDDEPIEKEETFPFTLLAAKKNQSHVFLCRATV